MTAPDVAPEATAQRRPHRLLRWLPILAVALAGVWLFGDREPEREIFWRLPEDRASIEQVEIQLLDVWPGPVFHRSEFHFRPAGAPREISQKLRLREGRYEAMIVLRRAGDAKQAWRQTLDVRGDIVSASLAR